MGIILESGPGDRKAARELAAMASNDAITYKPTGYAARERRHVWHEMRASMAGRMPWLYYLRKEQGSYVGSYDIP